MKSRIILLNEEGLNIFNGTKGGLYKVKSELIEDLYNKIEENDNKNIIEKTLLIPYKEFGDCIFRFVSYFDNLYIYEYETTVS